MIRLSKCDSALVGCKGRIDFQKDIQSTEWSYRKTTSSSRGLGGSVTLGAGLTEADATRKVCVPVNLTSGIILTCVQQVARELNISVSEVEEQYTVHQIDIQDKVCYTELRASVDYAGKNQGRAEFGRNDLGLTMEPIRWDDDSEMILTIHLPGQQGKC